MRHRLRFLFVLLVALLMAAGLSGASSAAVVAPAPESKVADDCVDGSTARVPMWAPDAVEPSQLTASEAAQLERRIAPETSAAQRDLSRGRIGRVNVETYVHVISTDGTAEGGNVTDGQIAQQMQVLNDAFGGRMGGAGSVFQFRLAEITRTVNPEWAAMEPESPEELAAKTALQRGDRETLNIYVVPFSMEVGLLGWAYLPDGEVEYTPWDGVVIVSGSLPGGDLPPYDEGDTATHEVGHWLALLHTFENGCAFPGDKVLDTPYEAAPQFQCQDRDSCRTRWGTDPIHNFMDYTPDACMNEFTGLQSLRMWAAWRVFRD